MGNLEAMLSLPLAATIDLQGRLPPFQQVFFTPTIIVSGVLLGLAIIVMVVLSRRAKAKAKVDARLEALRMVENILRKRGGEQEDVNRMLTVFKSYPRLDPAAMVMIRERFHDELRPLLEQLYDQKFGERMERIYFPPPKDTRRVLAAQSKDVKELVQESKTLSASQTSAAILDLMDATLRPGVVLRLAFGKLEGGHECLVMGHTMDSINVTLPANNPQLVAAIRPGMTVEGMLESGPSLLAFTASAIQAVAGSMPYCRLSAWKTAWEVRKRESMRLPISLDIDFQHISTAAADSINVSKLEQEIGSLRPGKLVDLSLGGCGIETPSGVVFRVGDMVRFSQSLVHGSPPATLLGAIVKVDAIDPEKHGGSQQSLHVQFLVIDDVSQRILVRTLRQLQDISEREEWMHAQQLLQLMRRNNIRSVGSPSPVTRGDANRPRTTRPGSSGTTRSTTRPDARPSTRSIPKTPRPPTRSRPKPPEK